MRGSKFYKNGSKTLLIWFGGINEPFFSPQFASESGLDCLYLLDSRKIWYTRGVLPEHESLREGVEFVSKRFEKGRYSKLVCCGQSSGGYGALLYGYHCKADLCIVFAPQTRNTFDGRCQMSPAVPIEDVSKLYIAGSQTRVIINISRDEEDHRDEFFWNDWLQVRALRNYQNATFVVHPYSNHAVSIKMRSEGLLYKYVKSIVDVYT